MMVPFARMSAAGRSQAVTAERLINLYAEAAPDGGAGSVILRSGPGLGPFATVGQGPIRGLHVTRDVLCAVSGGVLYSVDSNGTPTAIGTIPGEGSVHMADNGAQLVIVRDNGDGHVWDGTTMTRINDPDYLPASSCAFLNHYIVFGQRGSGRFFISGLLDAGSYDALDFATAEARPDIVVQVFAHNNTIWLFGERTTEVWWNTGDAAFPFERVSGGTIEVGCRYNSVAAVDSAVYWLGDDGVVYRSTGFLPQRVSTHAIEYVIRDRTGARAWAYKEEGHAFYVLGFDQGAVVFDAGTGFWHERQSSAVNRWRADTYARAYGKHLVGDYRLGRIYEMRPDIHSDGSTAMQRRAISPPIDAGGVPLFLPELSVRFDHGVGRSEGQGADPQVVLDWSDDGGRTWSNERWAAIGRIGEYEKRAVWRRLGRFRSRSFRLTYSEPTPFAIHGVAP